MGIYLLKQVVLCASRMLQISSVRTPYNQSRWRSRPPVPAPSYPRTGVRRAASSELRPIHAYDKKVPQLIRDDPNGVRQQANKLVTNHESVHKVLIILIQMARLLLLLSLLLFQVAFQEETHLLLGREATVQIVLKATILWKREENEERKK